MQRTGTVVNGFAPRCGADTAKSLVAKPRDTQQQQCDAVVFDTFNANGSTATLKQRIGATQALVLFVQESGVHSGNIGEVTDWCSKRKWHAVFCPAELKHSGKTAAGVAILCRFHIGLRLPEPHEGTGQVYPHRVLHCVLHIPGWPKINAVCGYLVSGVGLNPMNVDILKAIGMQVERHLDWVVAADWNLTVSAVEASKLPSKLEAKIVAPSVSTCISAHTASILDYFLASSSFSKVVSAARTVSTHPGGPHKPVQLETKPGAANLQQLVAMMPPSIPNERVFGPANKIGNWNTPLAVAQKAAQAAKSGTLLEAKALLDTSYVLFANAAELELIACTDAECKRKGLRGLLPRLQFQPVLNRTAAPDDDVCVHKGWQWLEYVARELLQSVHADALTQQQRTNFAEYANVIHGRSFVGFGLTARLDDAGAECARHLEAALRRQCFGKLSNRPCKILMTL